MQCFENIFWYWSKKNTIHLRGSATPLRSRSLFYGCRLFLRPWMRIQSESPWYFLALLLLPKMCGCLWENCIFLSPTFCAHEVGWQWQNLLEMWLLTLASSVVGIVHVADHAPIDIAARVTSSVRTAPTVNRTCWKEQVTRDSLVVSVLD